MRGGARRGVVVFIRGGPARDAVFESIRIFARCAAARNNSRRTLKSAKGRCESGRGVDPPGLTPAEHETPSARAGIVTRRIIALGSRKLCIYETTPIGPLRGSAAVFPDYRATLD